MTSKCLMTRKTQNSNLRNHHWWCVPAHSRMIFKSVLWQIHTEPVALSTVLDTPLMMCPSLGWVFKSNHPASGSEERTRHGESKDPGAGCWGGRETSSLLLHHLKMFGDQRSERHHWRCVRQKCPAGGPICTHTVIKSYNDMHTSLIYL